MPDAVLLMTVPGIGVLTATALLSFVGDVRRFRSSRHFAAYLGLTPREFSSGPARRLARVAWRVRRDQRPFERRCAAQERHYPPEALHRDDTDGTPV